MGLKEQIFTSEKTTFSRSRESVKFEDAWRSLRKDALIPAKREFSPRAFAPFLRNVILMDFASEGRPWSRIRVAGDGVRERVQSDLTSHDYLEFLPQQFHQDAVESIRLIYNHPCGVWQIMAAHYQRGFSQYLELTAFPLATDDGGRQLLILMVPHSGHVMPMPPGLSIMSMDTATVFRFLDIGAGAPVWRPAIV